MQGVASPGITSSGSLSAYSGAVNVAGNQLNCTDKLALINGVWESAINAKACGVKADGVSDDYNALVAFYNAVTATPGTIGLLPAGTIETCTPIVWGGSVAYTIRGAGPVADVGASRLGRTIIQAKAGCFSDGGKLLTLGDGTVNQGSFIADLTIDGNGPGYNNTGPAGFAAGHGPAYGIYIADQGFNRGVLQNVTVENVDGSGGIGIANANRYISGTWYNVQAHGNYTLGVQLTGTLNQFNWYAGNIYYNESATSGSTNGEVRIGTTGSRIGPIAMYGVDIEPWSNATNPATALLLQGVIASLYEPYFECHGAANSSAYAINVLGNTSSAEPTIINITGGFAQGQNQCNYAIQLPGSNSTTILHVDGFYAYQFLDGPIVGQNNPNQYVRIDNTNWGGSSYMGYRDDAGLHTPWGGLDSTQNYLLQSNTLATTWTVGHGAGDSGNPTVTNNFYTDPLGGTTASRVVFSRCVSTCPSSSYVQQIVSSLASEGGNNYTFSAWLKAPSAAGGRAYLLIGSDSGWTPTAVEIQVTGEWRRYQFSTTINAGDTGHVYAELLVQNANDVPTLEVWGAQLEDGLIASSYWPTTTSNQATRVQSAKLASVVVGTPSGSAPSAGDASISGSYKVNGSAIAGHMVVSGGTTGTTLPTSNNGVIYFPLGASGSNGTEGSAASQGVAPMNGTLKNLYCREAPAPGSGTSQTFMVRVQNADNTGSPAALSCQISGTNFSCNDIADSVSVTAGQVWGIKVTAASTPISSAGWCAVQYDVTI